MAREITAWLARRLGRRPWIGVAWLMLLGVCWVLVYAKRYIILGDLERLSLYGLEAAFLWFLIGGVLGLAALGEIELQLASLSPWVRWRVRGLVFLLLQGVPALPYLLPAMIQGPRAGGVLVVGVALLAQSALLASVISALPWVSLRALLFLAAAWWIPALVPGSLSTGAGWLAQVALRGIETGNIDNSPLWSGWLGSMLALTCLAFALDYARRPTT